MITLFFLLSIVWTFVSLAWFVVCNHYMSKGEMPKYLYAFSGRLQKIFFCCFPPAKAAEKKGVQQTGELKQSNSTKLNGVKLFCMPCFKRRVAAETTVPIDAIAIEEGRTTNEESKENAVCGMTTEPSESIKAKCHLCNRCETCQCDFDKDKAKGKGKKDVESKCGALNYLVLLIVFILMLVSNLALWLSMSA